MKKQSKKYLIGMLVSSILMFAWIFITVLLTGGKEIEDFTSVDSKIFICFIAIEIITSVVMLIFAVKLGRFNSKNSVQFQYVPKSKQEIIIRRRGLMLLVYSYLLALATMIIGISIGKKLNDSYHIYLKWTLAICSIIPILLIPMNILLKKLYVKKFERKKIGELQQYIVSHRDFAEKTSEQKLSFVKHWKHLTDAYSVIFSVFAIGIAFCAGILFDTDYSVPLCFVSAFFFLCTISRYRFSIPMVLFEEDKTYVTSDEYPRLYSLAKKAADTLQCSGEIKIAFLSNCNAGIAKIGSVYSVQLGVILLSVISEEELYNILLHEFSHMASYNNHSIKEGIYNNWICNGGNPHFLSGVTSLFFGYFDIVYYLQYNLYLYASSILNETAADQAMARYGNIDMATSSLLKLKYYDLFMWEKGTYDEKCLYAPEELEKKFLSNEIDSFKKAIKLRANDWNNMVDVEILSRNASHPTLKMRLASFGVTDYRILEGCDSDIYKKECAMALNHVEELIYQEQVEAYEENRKTLYLEPKSQIELWEAAGRPVVAEEYADINFALRQLGRAHEANELCDRAIAELSGAASCHAYFMKGCFLLHSYDESGIEYVYRAIENNANYIDEGLYFIGEFCCLTGKQDELDIYREKALVLAQKEKDEYSQIGTLSKHDCLSSEQLPDGMLDEILSFIRSADNGFVQNIYLVRKTITDVFFTSAFIIQFDPQTKEETQNEILHKIFCHLDTCSNWQFSLFNYTDVANVKVENIHNSCVYTKSVNDK